MAEENTNHVLVQQYDYHKEKEYYKIIPGLFFSSDRLVRVESFGEKRVLRIDTQVVFDEIVFNGEKVRITKIDNKHD